MVFDITCSDGVTCSDGEVIMTYSADMRWRAVTLMYVYGMPAATVGKGFGVSDRAVRRWYKQFESDGHVDGTACERRSSYPAEVVNFMSEYVRQHPCFYIEELREALLAHFRDPDLPFSHATILRCLRFELHLSRKVLERRAREALPQEVAAYASKLKAFYSYPEQLVFIDETAKKGEDSMRKYAWSRVGTKAVVRLPFRKGERVSVVAACDTRGFIAWKSTRGTFARRTFHEAFVEKVVPLLNPWPLPRSIVVLDNARIHMHKELADVVHQCGAILIYLPPYCPHFNSIKVLFGRLKHWLVRHANLAFSHQPEAVLWVAMKACVETEVVGVNVFAHCGYEYGGLRDGMFVCDA